MPPLPQHRLTKSNAQFERAVRGLPLGMSSTLRYWADARTIYARHDKARHDKGGQTWNIDSNSYATHGGALKSGISDLLNARKCADAISWHATMFGQRRLTDTLKPKETAVDLVVQHGVDVAQ